MGFTLTEDEFQAVADKYVTNDPERFFNYSAFVANINKAFTTKGIDKNPEARVQPLHQNDTLLARRKYLGGDQAAHEIEEILNAYREAVNTRRIHLKPCF